MGIPIVDISSLRGPPTLTRLETDNAVGQSMTDNYFVGITGYDPEMDKIADRFNVLWTEFAKHPELLAKYDGRHTGYQRGARDGFPRPGTPMFDDHFRRQLMIGPELESDNPLREFQPHGFYRDNIQIEEADFKGLVPLGVAYLEKQMELDIALAETFERSLGLPQGYIAARIVWGNSFLRAIDYRVQGEVVRTDTINGYEVNGKVTNGIKVADVKVGDTTYKNVVLINPHDDIDFWATVNKRKGILEIRKKDGTNTSYSATPNALATNSGIFQAKETTKMANGKPEAQHGGGVHWSSLQDVEVGKTVDYHGQTIVVFTHPRPTSPILPWDLKAREAVPPSFANVILGEILVARGHEKTTKPHYTKEFATDVMPDRRVIEKLLEHEQRHGITKLRRYEDSIDDLCRLWGI